MSFWHPLQLSHRLYFLHNNKQGIPRGQNIPLAVLNRCLPKEFPPFSPLYPTSPQHNRRCPNRLLVRDIQIRRHSRLLAWSRCPRRTPYYLIQQHTDKSPMADIDMAIHMDTQTEEVQRFTESAGGGRRRVEVLPFFDCLGGVQRDAC